MKRNSVQVKFTSADARKACMMLGDLIPEDNVLKARFIRRIQNIIVRSSKKAGVGWAKGLPTNNEF